jgi:hypothetical protein
MAPCSSSTNNGFTEQDLTIRSMSSCIRGRPSGSRARPVHRSDPSPYGDYSRFQFSVFRDPCLPGDISINWSMNAFPNGKRTTEH